MSVVDKKFVKKDFNFMQTFMGGEFSKNSCGWNVSELGATLYVGFWRGFLYMKSTKSFHIIYFFLINLSNPQI